MNLAGHLETADELSRRLAACEHRLQYAFADRSLLREALTHASGAGHRLLSNERMEFLGDAILGAVVSEILFLRYPEFQEGELTRVKSEVVSRHTCARLARALRLQDSLILGKGMGPGHGVAPSLLADAFESLVAAIHLDGGPSAARTFLTRLLTPEIEAVASGAAAVNFKSLLQQIAQRRQGRAPVYHLLEERGPDHNKCFKVTAQIGERRFQPAWGANKKEAEQRAARNALCEMKTPEPDRDA